MFFPPTEMYALFHRLHGTKSDLYHELAGDYWSICCPFIITEDIGASFVLRGTFQKMELKARFIVDILKVCTILFLSRKVTAVQTVNITGSLY
jgi:hypothetical protein